VKCSGCPISRLTNFTTRLLSTKRMSAITMNNVRLDLSDFTLTGRCTPGSRPDQVRPPDSPPLFKFVCLHEINGDSGSVIHELLTTFNKSMVSSSRTSNIVSQGDLHNRNKINVMYLTCSEITTYHATCLIILP